jgi:hypothetical protein
MPSISTIDAEAIDVSPFISLANEAPPLSGGLGRSGMHYGPHQIMSECPGRRSSSQAVPEPPQIAEHERVRSECAQGFINE